MVYFYLPATLFASEAASFIKNNISHKNWEISILAIKKRQSEVNTSSTSHREFQRKKEKTENKGPTNPIKIIKNN
jgi:hypothetical protein